jgi:protein-histidine pros-kinase
MTDAGPLPILDMDTIAMLRRFSGDEEIAQLFAVFHEEARDRLGKLKGALDAGDAASVAALTHSLRGISGTMGAMRLCKLSESLETAALEGAPLPADALAALEAEYQLVQAAMNQPA